MTNHFQGERLAPARAMFPEANHAGASPAPPLLLPLNGCQGRTSSLRSGRSTLTSARAAAKPGTYHQRRTRPRPKDQSPGTKPQPTPHRTRRHQRTGPPGRRTRGRRARPRNHASTRNTATAIQNPGHPDLTRQPPVEKDKKWRARNP